MYCFYSFIIKCCLNFIIWNELNKEIIICDLIKKFILFDINNVFFFIIVLVIRGMFGKKYFYYSDVNFFCDINNKFLEKKYLVIRFFIYEIYCVIIMKVF